MPITEWPITERPREKLLERGEGSLSDAELLAIVLRTGVKGRDAVSFARSLLEEFGGLDAIVKMHPEMLMRIKGLGLTKAAQLRAVFELARRIMESENKESNPVVSSSIDAIKLLRPHLSNRNKEIFVVLLLDSASRPIKTHVVEQGTVDRAYPIIREVFYEAIMYDASSIICAHNHPSGNVEPSDQDRVFTDALLSAAKILEIQLLDHIIIGSDKHFSFAEAKELY